MANENMRMSAVGMTALRRAEDVALRYYNDIANNCTWGVGTLAHLGPCSVEELNRQVTAAEVNAQLATRVEVAERAVRLQVRNHPLTQEQFDALVSFTFNLGARGARTTLGAANRGALNEVASNMQSNVWIHPRDARGRRLPAVRSRGLVNRRREETRPFQTQQQGR